jgi:hypothetical protein
LETAVGQTLCVAVDFERTRYDLSLQVIYSEAIIKVASRQTFSLWFYLGYWQNYAGRGKAKWRLPEFIKGKPWKNKLFWQDSFVTPFFKLVGCRLFGHSKKQAYVYDQQDRKGLMCPRCFTFTLREKVKKLNLDQMPLYVNEDDEVVKQIATDRLRNAK